MKSRVLSLIACGTFALATAACSDKTPDTAASDAASDMASADAADTMASSTMASPNTAEAQGGAATFLTDAMKGDNSEVKLGKLAASMGSAAGVKAFGSMLATDHGKAAQDVAALAGKMGVPTTTATKAEADAEYAKLQGLSGAAFDTEFARYMVEDHTKDIAAFEKEAASSDPAEVTALAKATLPTLKKHLAAAQALAK